MSLTVFVAIDIAGGKVVRLFQGDMSRQTVYGDSPADTARSWEGEGALWLHVVDLDGAVDPASANAEAVGAILDAVAIPVQVSGGVRSIEAVGRWLDRGAARVVVGTKALDPEFLGAALERFGDRVLPAVDARNGAVQVGGWRYPGGSSLMDAAARMAGAGAARLMFTDIERDGTLAGPNMEAIEELLSATGIPLIASGGVAGAEDILRLAPLSARGLEGVVLGRSLYSGALTLSQALAAAG